ncbi:branched-chain amino acid aminotransferase [Xinfangfangia sp. D13-10-4-6]|uniref:branched-chain amino acid aminotransferase n=1 Tax=Pseudogemmobacter hezensis TaxID=2737662 RepID=UPI0015576789|nr:branched-chain amino acid aminotransferase [Pseudogemmobacter hezensis]NPD14403.1 branched-chain amino acid aminotransferase [Pseudogemmobacter hezensis]
MTTPLSFTTTQNPAPMPEADRQAAFGNLGFGTLFSDHMAVIHWTVEKGWHDATVSARKPFELDPASSVLHYAQEIFEGMKAYRGKDGTITLFRPEENARRFNESARRMAMPEIPEADFINAVEALLAADAKWVPEADGASLYLRPFMFANEAFLGVRPSKEFIFCVIASPVGPYFKGGAKPVSIWATQSFTRAAIGGTGAAKCGGNYAASLQAQAEAAQNGCDQVVFLDAKEHNWIEELGGMNVFFVFEDGSISTPPLGTILPGITRKSLIQLAKDAGITVTERPYSFETWKADAASGKLKEAFACGTAAVVAGIGQVKYEGGSFTMGDGQTGPVTTKLRETLVGIQRGSIADPHGWIRSVSV